MLDKNGFDTWADNYDRSVDDSKNQFPFEGYYKVLSSVYELVKPRPEMKILDVGIGTGILSCKLAEQGCQIYGVDFSEKMIRKAEVKIPKGQFEIVDVNKNHLGRFNNIIFDRVISSYWFHHLSSEQKLSFVQRIIRCNLNNNGKVIIADIGFQTALAYNEAHEKYKDHWDENEYYLCGETLIELFREHGMSFSYNQISSCAGIMVYSIS